MRPPVRSLLLAVAGAILIAPAAASAAPAVHMDVTPITPVSGGTVAGGAGVAVPFNVRLADIFGAESVVVTIATSGVPTGDGVINPATKVGAGSLPAGETADNTYAGTASGTFTSTPGTYYFQFSYTATGSECEGVGAPCVVASSIFPLVVGAAGSVPPPVDGGDTTPPDTGTTGPKAPGFPNSLFSSTGNLTVWALADALTVVKPTITKGAKRPTRNLKRACHRAGQLGFQCITTWSDSRYAWRGTLRLRINSQTRVLKTRWVGTRATHTCIKKKNRTKCKFDWAF